MMTKDEAIHRILERLGDNEEAATELLDALIEDPELTVQNPRIGLAVIKLISVRMESGRIIGEAKEILDGCD